MTYKSIISVQGPRNGFELTGANKWWLVTSETGEETFRS